MYTVAMKKKCFAVLILLFALCAPCARAERCFASVKNGDRNEAAARVQERLFDLGYYVYKTTGSYGNVTARAVQAFQQAAGLPVTGRIGEEDWKLLFSKDAPLKQFIATVPVDFPGQNSKFTVFGEPVPWEELRPLFVPGQTYRIINAATGGSCRLVFRSGEGHADMAVEPRSVEADVLKQWLGSRNSFYKIGCVMEIEGKMAACSLQWDGNEKACVYFYGSVSHVLGLPDAEHEGLVLKAAGR